MELYFKDLDWTNEYSDSYIMQYNLLQDLFELIFKVCCLNFVNLSSSSCEFELYGKHHVLLI